MARYLYSELSSLIQARANCRANNNTEWFSRHEDLIERLVKNHMPHGSGFDIGTKIDLEASHAEKLVFHTSFHHMDENGYYCGWTEHRIVVTPSLSSQFNLRIGGRNRNGIKEYMVDEFELCLRSNIEWDLLRDCPVAKEHGLEIKSEWIDQSTQRRWFVMADGKEIFTPSLDEKYYSGSPYEQCEVRAVQYLNNFEYQEIAK